MAPTAKTFELRIEISGLCLFLKHPGGKKVAVLMPDARFQGDDLKHPDGTDAEPHIGYLRFDLANLATGARGIPKGDFNQTPSYEVVHQFDREELDIGIPKTSEKIDATNLELPDFDEFAPVKAPIPKLFDAKPPQELLMRTVLQGGELTSILEAGVQWRLSGELHPEGKTHTRAFGGEAHWKRTIRGDGITLRLTNFDTGKRVTIPLRPTRAPDDKPAIALKLANLCATNPLEWANYEPYKVVGPDKDFKWTYRLLQLKKGESPTKYPPSLLPHPHPIPSGNQDVFQDCFGGMLDASF